MKYKSKRSRATDIDQETKRKVFERDGGLCIFCYQPGAPNAHYIPRSQGGLGIEENIVTACAECHRKMDQSYLRPVFLERAREHLRANYTDWNEDKLRYRKGEHHGKDHV